MFFLLLKNIRSKEIGKLRFLFPTYLIVTCNCRKKVLRKNSEKGGIEKIGDTFFMDFYCISIVSSHFPVSIRISVRSCEGNIVKIGKIFSTENRYTRDILHRAIDCVKSFPIRLLADWFEEKEDVWGWGYRNDTFFAPKAFTESDRSFSRVVVWEIL